MSGPDEPGKPPEVEAELVEPEIVAPAPDATTIEGQPVKPGFRLTPRLRVVAAIIGAIVIVVAGVFVLPRLIPDSKPKPEKAEPSASIQEPKPAAPAADKVSKPDPAKIANPAADAKAALKTIKPEDAPPGRGLPPPPDSAISNNPLDPAAKEALKALQAPAAPPSSAERPTPEFQVAPPAEQSSIAPEDAAEVLARLEAQAEAESAAEASGAAASIPQPSAAAPPPPATNPTLTDDALNDFATAAAAFEAERRRLAADLSAERTRAEGQSREIDTLRAELAKLSAAAAAEGEAASATLALVALSRAVESGRPFEQEYAAVEPFAGMTAAARLLDDLSETGAPSFSALKSEFPKAAREALAANAEAQSPGLFGGLVAGLTRLVSVRPASPQAGASPDAVVSRIDARIAADDLGGAITEAESLRGAARPLLQPWIERAKTLRDARAATASLNAAFLASLKTETGTRDWGLGTRGDGTEGAVRVPSPETRVPS